MNSYLPPVLRARKPVRRASNRLLLLFVSLLLLIAAPSLNAQQQPGSQPEPRVRATAVQVPPEKQPPSIGKDATARTGSITGRVLGDDGHPIPNAAIVILPLTAIAVPTGEMTDADGKFQLKDVRPGAYRVEALAPGYVMMPDAGAELGPQRFYRVGENVNLTMVKGGVITGTVTSAEGEPVVGASVRAIRVRKPSERRNIAFYYSRDKLTDDRGIYRLYGLEPGAYVIAVGGSAQSFGNLNAFEGDAPTYYPSATRDTAAELTVHAAEELTGIDVRYRGERGHTVSGFVSGNSSEYSARFSGVSITLFQAANETTESSIYLEGNDAKNAFALNGIADGEYTLMAVRGLGNTGETMRATRKISVRGGDVTGVELKLEPLGALSGKVILEPPPKAVCPNRRNSAVEEVVITARRAGKEKDDENLLLSFFRRVPVTPEAKGEFRLLNLRSGGYQLDIQLPDDDWYVRSIALPGAAATTASAAKPTAQSKTAQPGAFILKSGERISGLTAAIGQGAAGLRGRVSSSTEGATLPAGLRVHLVPVEPERAADVLRYMESAVEREGVFALSGIAPGRYWLLARAEADDGNDGTERRAVALEAEARTALRREAERAGFKIELQPCQRLADYVLNYKPTPKETMK
jgi:protocatechuate 3,4-dioxygenase beta subunit